MKLFTIFILALLFVCGTCMLFAQSAKMEQAVTHIPWDKVFLQNNNAGQDVSQTPLNQDVLQNSPKTEIIQNIKTPVLETPKQNNIINPIEYSPLSAKATIFSQNFESAWTTPPTLSPAWSGTTGASEWHMNTYTTGWPYTTSGAYSPTGANSTTQSARFNTYGISGGGTSDLISPAIDFSSYIGLKAVDFYSINPTGTDVVNVYFSTDNGVSWGSSLKTVTTTAAWVKYTVLLGSSVASQCKIKFTGTSDYGNDDIGIDEVVVRTYEYANAPPITFNPTLVTQTSMTIGWTDNSTNETTFRVYRSTDNVTFTQPGADVTSTTTGTTGTTYSQAQTGLIPGTTYYFRIAAVLDGESDYLTGNQGTNAAGNITSAATGNWNAGATWVGGVAPTATDNVTIANGHTVTINAAAACLDLTVGQGSSGILRYGTTAVNLTVNGSVTVAPGATFDAGAVAGASLTHTLYIGGSTNTSPYASNLTVLGTFDMYIGASNGKATITFFGVQNSVVSGTGATLDLFNTTVLNKGTTTATPSVTPPILDIQRAFTANGVATTSFLATHTAGTLKISGTFTQTNPIRTAGGYTIPALGGVWLNNPNFTVSGQSGTTTNINGLLRISQGTYNIGTATSNSTASTSGAVYTIEGGALNIAGRLYSANAITYTQTGGTVTVATVGSSSTTVGSFHLAAGTFDMTGGNIVIQLLNGSSYMDYYNLATVLNASGNLQFGNASSGTAKAYRFYGYAPNVIIDGRVANSLKTYYTTGTTGSIYGVILGNLTINNTTSFLTNTWGLILGGNVTNNGSIVGTTIYDRVDFSGNGPQTYSGTGTFGTVGTIFGGSVGVANPDGVTLSAPLVVSRANLFTGQFINSTQITLGNGGTSSAFVQRGGSTGAEAGSFDVIPNFNYGSGGYGVTYYLATGSIVTEFEIPASRTMNNVTVNNVDGVVLAGGNLTLSGTLKDTIGTLSLGDNTLTVGSSGTVTGTSSASYIVTNGTGELKRSVSTAGVVFPIGHSSTSYNPLTIGQGTGATTDVFGVRVIGSNSPITVDPTKCVNRTWVTTEAVSGGNGTGGVAYTFQWETAHQGGSMTTSNVTSARYNGTVYVLDGGVTALQTTTSPYSYSANNFSSQTGTFTLGEDAALPIQLASFVGNIVGDGVKLDWQTISEINNYGFYVERRKQDTKDFAVIPNSFIAGHGTTSEPQNYSFTDNTLTESGSYEYRLKQVDNNGLVSYSNPIVINGSALSVLEVAPIEFRVHQNYPNPFNPTTTIKFSVERTEHALVVVYNALGQQVSKLFDGVAEPGHYYKVQLNGNALGSGVYYYRVLTDSKSDLKKMLLVK
jgi:hypothetical protein